MLLSNVPPAPIPAKSPTIFQPNGDGVPSARAVEATEHLLVSGERVVTLRVIERTNDAEGDPVRVRSIGEWIVRAEACTPMLAEAVSLLASALVSPPTEIRRVPLL